MPMVLNHKKTAVRLGEILHAKFDEGAIRDGKVIDKELDNAVLTPLRENLELVLPQRPRWRSALHHGEDATLIHLDFVNIAI